MTTIETTIIEGDNYGDERPLEKIQPLSLPLVHFDLGFHGHDELGRVLSLLWETGCGCQQFIRAHQSRGGRCDLQHHLRDDGHRARRALERLRNHARYDVCYAA